MELAARRRNYEVANILKRRRAEENAVWSWWMVRHYPCEAVSSVLMVSQTQLARDELQTTMIAETNRKRRKLERDRRAAEKPPPSTFIQVGLQTPCYTNVRIALRLPPIPHEIPIPPTLHEIINKNPHSASSSSRSGKGVPAPLRAYPSLSSLSSGEITHDLEYLLNHNHRWPPEPPPSRYDSFAPPTAPPTMGIVLDMSSYGRQPPPAPSQRRRYPPGPSGLQHELEHGAGPLSRSLTPHGGKVNGWGPSGGGSRPGDSMDERGEEMEMERARERDREIEFLMHKQQQQQQQQQVYIVQQQPLQQPQQHATRPLPHSRSDPHVGPGQGPPLPPQPHHSSGGHHHHHVHHHHVHHHHHNSNSAPPPSQPPPPPAIPPLHPYDGSRLAPPRDLEPPRPSTTEVMNLPSGGGTQYPPRQWEREREPPSPRHRDRERDREREREREREQRDRDRGRPASGPPPTGPHERIMTPFNAPLPPPSSAPRPSRGSFSESTQPPPPQPPNSQQGGTPLGSPVRTRVLPGRMVSPPPLPPPPQPPQSTQAQILHAHAHAHTIQGQVTMSPPKAHRMPPPPASPSAKPMDGERERDRVVLPPPPPPLPSLPPPPPSAPQSQSQPPPPPLPTPVSAPTAIPPASPSAHHAHAHRLPLPPPPPAPPLLPQGQGQGQGPTQPPPPVSVAPPPSVPVAAGEGA